MTASSGGKSPPPHRPSCSSRKRPHACHGLRGSHCVSPGLLQPLHGALTPFGGAAFLKHTLQSFPKVPLLSPHLPQGSPAPAGDSPKELWQDSCACLQAFPLWTVTQSSGKPSLKNTESDFPEGGSWSGMVVQRKVRCQLLLGAFFPHISVSLSKYKLTYQDSSKTHQFSGC